METTVSPAIDMPGEGRHDRRPVPRSQVLEKPAGGALGVGNAPEAARASDTASTWALLLAGAAITIGLIWDMSWDMSFGRDSFWSPPHLAVNVGGTFAAGAAVWWAARATRRRDPAAVGFGRVRMPLGAAVVLWGSAAMLASGALEIAWSRAYGMTIGAWTPPQVLFVIAVSAVLAGILLAAASRGEGGPRRRVRRGVHPRAVELRGLPPAARLRRLVLRGRRAALAFLRGHRRGAAAVLGRAGRAHRGKRAGVRPCRDPGRARRAGAGAIHAGARAMSALRQALACAALVILAAPDARAHIGSPNVYFTGQAGPYAVRVVIRPPLALPGRAEVNGTVVEGEGVKQVRLLAAPAGVAPEMLPPPDVASPVGGVAGLHAAEPWIMAPGAYGVRVAVAGNRGVGEPVVPLPAVNHAP